MDLERQAVRQQGQVISLLGNHEVIVMMGDLRYVQPEDFQTFATDQSKEVRARAYEEDRTFLAGRENRRQAPDLDSPSARLKLRRMVVAQTVTDSRQIASRFDKRVFLIHTGMMLEPRHQGRASALEIQNRRFVAAYAEGKEPALLSPADAEAVPAPCPREGSEKQQE